MAVPESYTIVIVDDVPEIREILRFLLEESGWFRVVGEAASGEAALELVSGVVPDLVLLDVDMPGMSGWEVLPLLRNAVPGVAVVVLSGTIEERLPGAVDGMPLADAVVDKGVSNRQLIDRLLAVLGRERAAGPEAAADSAPDAAVDVPGDATAWLTAVLASTSDAIVGTALDGTIVSWNGSAERIFGYAADEIVGRSIRALVPPDNPEEWKTILDLVRGGDRLDSYDTVRVHKDGSRIDVALTVVPVLDADGSVIGISAVARNISNRRQTDAALARAITQLERRNRELSRSNEELDTFAAVASHDLAQPLQVAYGFLDMLRTDYGRSIPEPGSAWLESSLASLERMRNLVRDILRYARSGSGEPRREPVDLSRVVAEAAASVGAAIEERQAQLDVDEGLPTVVGDHGQLALVVQNLLANAIKFVPAGRRPKVHVAAEAADREVVLRVIDNGIGIAEEHRTKVFDMFQRGGADGEDYDGSGLGLAIVKKIATRHGGTVWIEDGIDGGSAICVQLPSAPTVDLTGDMAADMTADMTGED